MELLIRLIIIYVAVAIINYFWTKLLNLNKWLSLSLYLIIVIIATIWGVVKFL